MDSSASAVTAASADEASVTVQATRLPFAVYLLAAVAFLTGTTELILAGLLPQVADALRVSIPDAGGLVTVFAIGMMLGAPVMTLATLRMPRRSTLVLTLLTFSIAHFVVAVSSDFTVVMLARLLAAVATGTFWALGSLVATEIAGQEHSARAMSLMVAGTTLSNIVGVPLGTFVGQMAGWQGPFWALGVLAAGAAVALILRLPPTGTNGNSSVRAEFASLRRGRLWLSYLGIALAQGAILTTYTYVAPLVTERAALPEHAVPLVMLGFGLGALMGTAIGGRFGDRHPYRVVLPASLLVLVVVALLAALGHIAPLTVILIGLLGLFGLAIPPVLISQVIRIAGPVNSLAVSIGASSFQVGVALGSSLGGMALASSRAETGPAVASTAVGVFAVAVFAILAATGRTRTPKP